MMLADLRDAPRGSATTMSSSCPRLVSIRSPKDFWQYCICLLTDSRYFLILAAYVVLGDAVLTQLIIRFVPCKMTRVPFLKYCWLTFVY